MNYITYALGGNARCTSFGAFEIPAFPYQTQYDSMRHDAAVIPAKYERGEFYFQRLAQDHLQKIEVCDLIWQLWGTDVQALEQEADVMFWVNVELSLQVKMFNDHSPEKIQLDVRTFYSDNPEYLSRTVPRIIVCRISRPADFE